MTSIDSRAAQAVTGGWLGMMALYLAIRAENCYMRLHDGEGSFTVWMC